MSTREALWHRENPAADAIPYAVHIDPHTIKTYSGDYIQVIRVDGIAHESADTEDVFVRKDQLNMLYRNIAHPDIALWSHLVRYEENHYPAGDFDETFADRLNDKYQAHLNQNKMMVNKLYLTIVYRPEKGAKKALFKFDKRSQVEKEALQHDHLERLHDVTTAVLSGLSAYSPVRLSTYEHKNILFSESLEFLSFLINGEWQRFPLTRNPINEVLATSRVFFGQETIEIRSPVNSTYGAIVSIKEYPESSEPGLLNAVLSAPFPLILTQSFTFKSRPVATELLKRQRDRMINAGDLAQSQIAAINDALDDLTAGRFVMGDHHLSLTVLGEDKKALNQHLSQARSELSDTGLVIAREDLAIEAAWWAQLPGNFKYRPRPAPITSKNFAGFASLHNYPSGRISCNQWGPAVTLFKTSSGAPYYFNFHEMLDSAKDIKAHDLASTGSEQQKALGNTVLIGPSGSGKTVVQSFLLAQAQKFKPTSVIFDKDRGLEIFTRAMGGVYLPLQKGEATGFNPFKIEATPKNIHFLETFVKKLVSENNTRSISTKEDREIANAVQGVMTELQPAGRRLSAVLAYLDKTDPEGAGARLSRWCEMNESGKPGALAWVFDHADDSLDFDHNTLFGFDITEFLDDAQIRTPIVMYLFHRMEALIDGRRFMGFMDEFWKMLMDEYFEDFANNKLKTIRKQDGLLVLGTQSPRDVLNSPIAHSIIEQCSTFIFLPNPKATEADYVEGFKLTHREFDIIRHEMPEGSRRFLIKQGHSSVVAELDLKGFDDELAVLSGNTDTVMLMEAIIKEHGDDPATWLPVFQAQRQTL